MHRTHLILVGSLLGAGLSAGLITTGTAEASQAGGPGASSTYHESDPAPDQDLTTQQRERSTPFRAASGTWHWMGNYGDVYSVANAANARGVGPGQIITQHMPNGLLATFMYY